MFIEEGVQGVEEGGEGKWKNNKPLQLYYVHTCK